MHAAFTVNPTQWVALRDPPSHIVAPPLWFIYNGPKLLVEEAGANGWRPYLEAWPDGWQIPESPHFLGLLEGRPCWAASVDGTQDLPPGGAWQGLGRLFGQIPEGLFATAGYAYQIVFWDETSRYCGRCGSLTAAVADERAKRCARCGCVYYPRIAPVIIVAVVRGDRILLGRARRFRDGMYSVLAGFVEAGETLEACVRREVREETGIRVRDIRYFGSQPWPFPHSLMIGFNAAYAGGEIIADQVELADARWFTSADLPPLPPRGSIARALIDGFIARPVRD